MTIENWQQHADEDFITVHHYPDWIPEELRKDYMPDVFQIREHSGVPKEITQQLYRIMQSNRISHDQDSQMRYQSLKRKFNN